MGGWTYEWMMDGWMHLNEFNAKRASSVGSYLSLFFFVFQPLLGTFSVLLLLHRSSQDWPTEGSLFLRGVYCGVFLKISSQGPQMAHRCRPDPPPPSTPHCGSPQQLSHGLDLTSQGSRGEGEIFQICSLQRGKTRPQRLFNWTTGCLRVQLSEWWQSSVKRGWKWVRKTPWEDVGFWDKIWSFSKNRKHM